MSDLRTAALRALEAMDDLHRTGDTQVFDLCHRETTEALRAALADTKVDSQAIAKLLGPAAWQWLDTGHYRKKLPAKADTSHWRPLYAAPNIPPEAQTEAEKIAYCAGWWAAMETKR